VRYLDCHRKRNCAAARSEVNADRPVAWHGGEGIDCELGDLFRFGPRDEDAWSDGELERPESGDTRNVLERLTRDATFERRRGDSKLVVRQFRAQNRLRLHFTATAAKHMPDQELGVGIR
jgi:hypothetical protein